MKLEKVYKNCLYWKEINDLALEAFPVEEYLSPDKLVDMSKDECFNFYYLCDDNTFIGFVALQIYKDLCYLFFLAVSKNNRNKGYGSKIIKLIKEKFSNKTHIVDFEMLDIKSNNFNQRIKRREFYLKNGYKETGLFLSYLGVDYEVFCSKENFDEKSFIELMKHINVEGFNPRYFRK